MVIIYLIVSLIVCVAALKDDPAQPVLPKQYTVKNVYTEMFTNAGYPPHYTETDSAQYFDYEASKQRYDVAEASYGTKGPYTIIKDFSETFPVSCGPQGTFQAPRGYFIEGSQCCYVNLIQNCPAKPGEFPEPDNMYVPELPKMIKYDGVVNSDIVANNEAADLWSSTVMLKQTVPFMVQDYYFDTGDHSTQLGLGEYIYLEATKQFINATTTYKDGTASWTIGAPDASVFDLKDYDCSTECKSNVDVSPRSRVAKFAATYGNKQN